MHKFIFYSWKQYVCNLIRDIKMKMEEKNQSVY